MWCQTCTCTSYHVVLEVHLLRPTFQTWRHAIQQRREIGSNISKEVITKTKHLPSWLSVNRLILRLGNKNWYCSSSDTRKKNNKLFWCIVHVCFCKQQEKSLKYVWQHHSTVAEFVVLILPKWVNLLEVYQIWQDQRMARCSFLRRE